ncbi:glycosyltransferase family 9 protein [Arcticibacter tournemirensis]
MHFKHRNKFRLTRFIIFQISPILRFLSKFRKPAKRILIVKIDAIGDYVLFRNYLEVVYKSDKFKGYEIELLGNISWKELALEYDKEFVSKFIFIHEDSLYQKPGKVFKLGLKLFKRKYELVLQSTYSRTLMGNGLSALASGRETIAYNSDNEHHPKYKKRTDKFYSTLFDLPPTVHHEYERNHYFFEKIIRKEGMPLPPLSLPFRQKERSGIVIFPGSSWRMKNWEKEKFLKIIKRLLLHTSENIILAGGPAEVATACYLIGQLPPNDRIKDKTGNTTLPQLVKLVAESKFVISNDTNTVHVAAATSTPVICIHGGGHFGRFLPYSEKMTFKPVAIYDEMSCYNCSWICKYYNEESQAYPCISRINIERVWAEALKLL